MKRVWAMILGVVFLCGCGSRQEQAEKIQRYYGGLEKVTMEAEAVAHLGGENRSFTIRCLWEPEGATTTILAPEELEGLSATVAGEEWLVNWDGAALAAGRQRELSPAACIPWMLHAAAEGYLMEIGRELIDGMECLRLALDTTAMDGEKILCTIWFTKDDFVPCYIEFSSGGAVVLTLRTLSFEADEKGE